jgi:ribonuclease D
LSLPPHQLITTPAEWQTCFDQLLGEPRLALDLEANSMYAYQESVCLIQISIPTQDFIIDPLPLTDLDLSGLGKLLADPAVEKVFHAAEYDLILLKRNYDWPVVNLFDTMWAARILGYPKYGLANMLKALYGVNLNKRYQRANWCKRPLSSAHLTYAQHDTHFLLNLREHLLTELESRGRLAEAYETFAEQTQVDLPDHSFSPDDFWSINGATDLNRKQQAILRELAIFRDQEAQRRDQPHFKVFGDRTLLELAQRTPHQTTQMQPIYGMSERQIRRYGRRLLQTIERGRQAAPPTYKRTPRPPEEVLDRFERLHHWRKMRARARGVESDVIVSRNAIWEIAKQNPDSPEALADLGVLGKWRHQEYGAELLSVLREVS